MVAVGVPLLTLMMANLALVVALPPILKSTVALLANSSPELWLKKASVPPEVQAAQTGVLAPETKQRLAVEVVALANTPVVALP